ncbi:30S ribosomal protein S20 [Phragmitibacter flavus]|uniref:Small ribosomal subunit protein bS20 n=1 Tax=Phragmitibacter flavus TaxID=2576071 RepID=A0A5R8KG17_9BACT|nr:30S ribosomal protein S20 [Phragmitibacter flavus]TLD71248.1 30S ribosomal protein S20 [Phragmitibacter flavus]
MANIRSSEKSIRKTKTRTLQNQVKKSRIRTLRKKVLAAVAQGDNALAQQCYNEFSSAADKAAKSSTIHKNTASRLKSRVASQLSKSTAAN